MKNVTNEVKEKQQVRAAYTPPAVIYRGKLSTRAGSPAGVPGDTAVDPADLFGN
jgi:hypothetical protein